jgi:hypothetical protein
VSATGAIVGPMGWADQLGLRAERDIAARMSEGDPIPIRFRWQPMLSVALGAFAGAFTALAGAVAGSAAQIVGPLDTRLIAALFAIPLAAAVAASIATPLSLWHRPYFGLVAGVLGAALAAYLIGLDSVGLANWWLSDLPTDSNRASAYLALPLAFLGAFGVTLAAAGTVSGLPRESSASMGRFLISLGGATGVLTGAGIGTIVGAIQGIVDCAATASCTYSPNVSSAMESGSADGATVGLAVGLLAGLLVAGARGLRRRSE